MGIVGRITRYNKKLNGIIENNLNSVSKTELRTVRWKMVFAKKLCGIGYSTFFHYQCERASYRLLFKMMFAKHFCVIDVSGIYRYRCENASYCQLLRIVPFSEQDDLWSRVNSVESRVILNDKYKAYLHFKDYYQRDLVIVSDKETKEGFGPFCLAHSRFIVKPLAEACGRGIQLIDTSEAPFSVDDYLDSYPDGFVAEELINQERALSILHPESVNTLRINTVNYGTSIEVIWPCLRMGRGESVVDNAGAGGVFGAIDIATGLITNVSDEHNHTFTEHPDTGIPLIGFKVPKWEDACELAKRLAELIPDCHFVGWDLALTDNGWVMIEGNHNPYIIWQIATGKGIRKDFNRIKRRLLKI